MILGGGQPLIIPHRNQNAVWTCYDIRQAGRAVSADTVAREEMDSNVELVSHRRAPVQTDAAPNFVAVVGAARVGNVARAARDGRRQYSVGRRDNAATGEDAIAEVANQTKNFVMPKAWLDGQLGDEVWRRIKGVVGGGIVETCAGPLRTNEEVVLAGGEGSSERGLRVLHRGSPGQLVAQFLGDPEAILPRPTEADSIRRVDGHRRCLAPVVHALLGLGNQAPHLASGESPPAVQSGLRERLPLAECVAVALVVVRCNAGGQ